MWLHTSLAVWRIQQSQRRHGPKTFKPLQGTGLELSGIRFLNAAGHEVLPRKDRIWTTSGVASRMIEALMAVNRPVPEYLKDLAKAEQGD